jgi:DNA polymerase III subunit delta'
VSLPIPLAEATADQPRAGASLGAALAAGPVHAYLLRGPRGSGKRAAARSFAAELLADGAPDPDSARRRALADPPRHPDLVWLAAPGPQHLVEEVRELVIRAAALRPLEGRRRVFVIDEAEALREESQNALLKTLEEPAPFAHLVLISSEPELLSQTVLSRCQPVQFVARPPEAIEGRLAGEGEPAGSKLERRAAARLCRGDIERARFLLSDPGRDGRAAAERCMRAARWRRLAEAPWHDLLERAELQGSRAAEAAAATDAEAGLAGRAKPSRQAVEGARRAARRARTAALDLELDLCGLWLRDLGALAEGADEAVFNLDRAQALREDAAGLAPDRAWQGVELVTDARRRLRLNASEELTLEALLFRLEDLIAA